MTLLRLAFGGVVVTMALGLRTPDAFIGLGLVYAFVIGITNAVYRTVPRLGFPPPDSVNE